MMLTSRRLPVVLVIVIVIVATMLTGACIGDPADPTSPRRNADPPTLPATSQVPVPTGTTLASATQFDADPCAVATAAELGAAIAGPYHLLAANTLAPVDAPSTVIGGEGRPEAIGCGYRFAAPNDASEAYHEVVVRIARWKSGGPALLAACRTAAAANPARYLTVNVADEACLGPDAILPLRSGAHHYTVAVTAKPSAANVPDEDVSIGAITIAATRVLVSRLPRQ